MVRDGCGQPDHWTLKLTVSQEWVDGMNWFFACCCKFRKAKSNFNDFWVDVWPVAIGLGHLVHETLNVFMNWADFLHAECDAIILIRPTFYSIPLTFKCQFTAVLLAKPLVVPERILRDRVCPFLPPDICLGVFLELDH